MVSGWSSNLYWSKRLVFNVKLSKVFWKLYNRDTRFLGDCNLERLSDDFGNIICGKN